jgi:hypothetical protein
MSRQIENLRKLGLTDAEIADVLKTDKEIDRGANPFPLSAEQEKASKDARQADRKPTVYKLDNTNGKRSKKADTQKQLLIDVLSASLTDHTSTTNLEIINPEREFTFEFLGKKYKVVLSAPRS